MKKILAFSLSLFALSPLSAKNNLIFEKNSIKSDLPIRKTEKIILFEHLPIAGPKKESIPTEKPQNIVGDDWPSSQETEVINWDAPVIIEETPIPYEDSYYWNGQKLTSSLGTVQGPSGTERYYNLDMSGVINLARSQGIEGDYWIREDGVKMYGSYIICACGFNVRPRGTIVDTSLGTGICLDTGGFAASDPYMIDIATTW